MTSRGRYRRHSTPFKLQLCQDIRSCIIGRRDAQRSHNISANLMQLWLTQFDRGELTCEEAEASVITAALLRKSAFVLRVPFPVVLQAIALISALPRAETRFMMAMRIWISAAWRSGSRDMIRSPKSFRRFV